MLHIKRFQCNQLQENCYVVSDDTKECVVVDCGAFYPEEKDAVVHYIRDNGLTPRHLLATHGHFDHNFGNAALHAEFGLLPEICAEDADMLEDLRGQTERLLGISIDTDAQPPAGQLLRHGDTISFGTHTLEVLQTPGHSRGSALFYCQDEHVALTGDTLFRMSIGRTDLPEGSWPEMSHSLETVVRLLPPETTVLPGHGPKSTMADELAYNPYLRSL